MRATELREGSTQNNPCSKLANRGQMPPRLLQYYFLLGGGAGFRSAATFCNSVTDEAVSS